MQQRALNAVKDITNPCSDKPVATNALAEVIVHTKEVYNVKHANQEPTANPEHRIVARARALQKAMRVPVNVAWNPGQPLSLYLALLLV